MKRGLVIGKFMPVHAGHIALIRFAAAQCDELIVSLSYKPDDPISGTLRFGWLKEIFKDEPAIKPFINVDDFDDESLPWPERTKIWTAFIQRTFPPVQILFSSEVYGDHFASNLNVQHTSFDPSRNKVPVSATLIRQRPFEYWDFIPPVVKPFFVKKVCFYGPESTGKSTLTKVLAEKYGTEFVPEVAREMLTTNDFMVEDIIRIGIAHYERIQEKLKTANKILFCDTDAITTQIYSKHYLHVVPDVLYELEEKVQYDHYFLMDIDVPWIADGLRDLGHLRKEMFTIFKQELDRRNIPYSLIRGNPASRLEQIDTFVREQFFINV